MYLYWFERIIRKMSGDSSFALPFWDYESPGQRTLPVAFRDPATKMYTANRGTDWNTGAASFPRAHVDSFAGMAIGGPGLEGRAFFTAGEVLEQNPHNNVHVHIGGWMGSPLTAAQDPVFYVHAANIDRLWNLWMTKGGLRYDPLFLDVWKNKRFTFFDEDGREVHMTGCDVMRCAEQLNYTYEGEPPQVKEYCPNPLPALSSETWLLEQGPVVQLTAKEVAVPISLAAIRKPRSEWLQNMPAVLQPNQDAFLALNFPVQAESEPGAVWEVYLGLEPDQPANSESPNFLGTVSLYSRGVRSAADRFHSHAGEQLEVDHFLFPAARALEAPLKSGLDKTFVRFVPTGPLVDGKPSQPVVLAAVQAGPVNLSLCWAQEPHD
jgi:tyrosinase